MSLHFFNEDVGLPKLNYEAIIRSFKGELRVHKALLGSINYIFCSDTYLLELNIKFLKHDYFTDVITFDYSIHNFISGDVFVSVDRVRENAILYKTTFHTEMSRVVFHGILHLCGYNDKIELEIAQMRAKEDLYINHFVSREAK